MPLHAAVSYVAQRCSRQQFEASKAVFFALCEDKLEAVANKLVRDLAPAPGLIRDRDQPRHIVGHIGSGYADTGFHPVSSHFRVIGIDQNVVLDIQQRAVLQLTGQPAAISQIFRAIFRRAAPSSCRRRAPMRR
jgi:hypothetical protein